MPQITDPNVLKAITGGQALLGDSDTNALANALKDDPALQAEFATKAELDGISAGEGNLPAGGTTGQILRKKSGDAFDTEWVDPEASEGSVPETREIVAGTGLTGGGTLDDDRTISLDTATITSLGKADSAVQPGSLAAVATTGAYSDLSGTPTLGTAAAANTGDFVSSAREVTAGTGLDGGGQLDDDIEVALSSASIASLGKADTALQPADVVDEDDMASDSATKVPTQQSVKAYVTGSVANAPVICVWDGSAWETAVGGSVPTSTTLIRHYNSQDDPAADPPTFYNPHDLWFGTDA